MENPNLKSLIQHLSNLGVLFGVELSEQRLALYVEGLSDIPEANFASACLLVRCNCKFFPSVSELRKFAMCGTWDAENLAEHRWYALRSLSGYPAYHKAALADHFTKICFERMGGPSTFGTWDYDKDEHWRRKHFIEMYATLLSHPPVEQLSGPEGNTLLKKLTENVKSF